MLEAFENGQDIHAATAAKIFKVPLAEVTVSTAVKLKRLTLE
jgi:DNA polymerase-1